MVLSQLCAGDEMAYVVLINTFIALALVWWFGHRYGSGKKSHKNKHARIKQRYESVIWEKNDEIKDLKKWIETLKGRL